MHTITIPVMASEYIDKTTGEIPVNPGHFTITFDAEVNDDILNNISFRKKIGENEFEDIAGGAFVETDVENPKNVIVKYGVLEYETEYILDVCGNTYNYYTDEDPLGYEETFDRYEVGAQLPARPEEFTVPIIYYPTEDPDPTHHYIGQTEDGDKFVRLDLSKATSSQGGTMVLEFPQPIENQDICVDMKLRILSSTNGGRTRSCFGTYFDTSNASRSIVAQWNNGIAHASNNLANGTYADNNVSFPSSDDFYNLRLSIRRNADGTFTQTLEDLNNPDAGKIIHTNKSASYSKIYKIWLARFYGGSSVDIGLDVSYVRVFSLYDFDVLNVSDLCYDDEELALAFSDDVDENTLSNITMTDSIGKYVKLTYDRYDTKKRTAYYTIGEVLDCSEDYHLSLEGVKNTLQQDIKTPSVKITTMPSTNVIENYYVTDENGASIQNIGSSKTVTVSTEITGNVGQTFTLALAIFDGQGRLMKVVSDTKTIDSDDTKVQLSKTTPENIDLNMGCVVRQYIWEEDAVEGNTFIYVPEALQ